MTEFVSNREDFDRYPRLFTRMERVLCPRVHFKCVIIDGRLAYFGSANNRCVCRRSLCVTRYSRGIP